LCQFDNAKILRKLIMRYEKDKCSGHTVTEAEATDKETPVLKDIPYSNRLRKQIIKVAKLHTEED